MKKNKWEMAGVIGVDAGLCWIGDPCYVMGKDANEQPRKTWNEFCDKLHEHEKLKNDGIMQWNYKLGHEGLGVSIGCFGGDGTYPVYVRRTIAHVGLGNCDNPHEDWVKEMIELYHKLEGK